MAWVYEDILLYQVDAWAQSNTVPGLFTGSTGAQVLSSEELSTSGPQAWLKKVSTQANTRYTNKHKHFPLLPCVLASTVVLSKK